MYCCLTVVPYHCIIVVLYYRITVSPFFCILSFAQDLILDFGAIFSQLLTQCDLRFHSSGAQMVDFGRQWATWRRMSKQGNLSKIPQTGHFAAVSDPIKIPTHIPAHHTSFYNCSVRITGGSKMGPGRMRRRRRRRRRRRNCFQTQAA